jgi:hypothetical protein
LFPGDKSAKTQQFVYRAGGGGRVLIGNFSRQLRHTGFVVVPVGRSVGVRQRWIVLTLLLPGVQADIALVELQGDKQRSVGVAGRTQVGMARAPVGLLIGKLV